MAGRTPAPRKSLGQHWLDDVAALESIRDEARLTPADTVLEIGPGPGSLTRMLAEKAGRVIAVELDEKLAAELPGRVKAANLEVVSEDILRFDLARLPTGYKVVANIPYYLTGKLLRLLSETPDPPSLAVLLLQKEVAERVAAEPGDMSILSVICRFYWQISLGDTIPAALFTPPPKVDSRILTLHSLGGPLFSDVDPAKLFRLIKAGFAQPRKTLLNNLGAGFHMGRQDTQAVCERASIDPRRRAQTLDMDEWHRLYGSLYA